jgi:short-subunit dehydrogenase
VIATARSLDKLQDLSDQSKTLPGEIIAIQGDVTDLGAMKNIVHEIEQKYGGLDMAILNAGTYIADPITEFTAENFKNQVDLNLSGTANCLEAILPSMIKRGAGHIALVASVAGYRGLPRSLSYGPTKAALINMAEALAIEGRDHNIKVQVINPGFVKTPLTDKNKFPMPFLISADEAAEHIAKGLQSRRFEITFPFVFAALLKIIGLLPADLYIPLTRSGTKKI